MKSAVTRVKDERLPSLTGMRFVAAGLVFVYHASYEQLFTDKGTGNSFAHAASTAAYMGVSFFFILSGFVLTWSARPGQTALRFWRRRAAKIYPNHVVTWLVTLLLLGYVGQRVTAGPAALNLFLLHTWVPKLDVFGSVNPVSWSLACEVLFYALFPLLLPLISRIRAERLWLWAGVIVAVIFAMPTVAKLLPAHPLMPTAGGTSVPQFWFVYGFPPVRGLEFLLGMVMARIVITGKWIRVGVVPATLLVVAGYWLTHQVSLLYSMVAVTVIPLALVIPAAAASDLKGAWSPMRTRPLIVLGEISYAFYLIHYLVIHSGHLAFGRMKFMGIPVATHTWSTGPAIGMILLFLAISLALSGLLYRFVERPVMDHWSRPRDKTPVPPVEVTATRSAA